MKHKALFGLLAAALCLTSASSSATPPANRLFTAQDVFALKFVGDVRIDPTGRTIAYETSDADIMTDGRHHAIRLVDRDGGHDRLLADNASGPRWSPDGRMLTYAAELPDGGTGIMLVTLDMAPPRLIARIDGSPSAMVWSPDGATLAFTMFVAAPDVAPTSPVPRPAGAQWAPAPRVITGVRYAADGQTTFAAGHNQLFTLPVAGGPPRRLTTAPLEVNDAPVWAPDGRSLIYSAENLDAFGPSFHVARLYRIAATGGEPAALSPPGFSAHAPALSPDGKQVAFIAWAADGRDFSTIRLHVMAANGGRSRTLADALDRDFFSATWAADGRSVYAAYADHSVDKVRRIPVDGAQSVEAASGLDGGFTVARDGTLAYPAARPDRPADVAVRSPGGTVRLLTQRNDALLAGKALGAVQPLTARSSLDGASVGGWLTLPAGYAAGTRYPLILDIHGGPHGYDGPVWTTADQLYAAAGYAVLHVNYRGSTSYGFAFADRIAHDPVAPGFADLMSAVDAAIAAGIADARRLFVTGGSAGGELTAWIVGNTDRFRAAVAEKPVIDRTSQALTSDQYTGAEFIAGPKPWEDAARQWAWSPLSRVAHVATPTMLIVGEEDRRTPPAQAQQFYNALLMRRIPTALVMVPGASHESLGRRPSQFVAQTVLTLDWFARFGGAATDPPLAVR